MPADQTDRYALGRLVLDYLRMLMWPVVVLVVVVVYADDVRNILSSREVEVAGVFKIGQQVKQIEESAAEEIADIRALLEKMQADPTLDRTALAVDIKSKLDNLSGNLSREVEQIQQTAPAVAAAPPAAVEPGAVSTTAGQPSASTFERDGFQALIDRDIDKAIANFGRAKALYPDYHNVSEIHDLLVAHQADLKDRDSPSWERAFRQIVAEYSWGMPAEFRPEFRKYAAESYR
jgi:hypothetical protein